MPFEILDRVLIFWLLILQDTSENSRRLTTTDQARLLFSSTVESTSVELSPPGACKAQNVYRAYQCTDDAVISLQVQRSARPNRELGQLVAPRQIFRLHYSRAFPLAARHEGLGLM